MLSYFCSVSWWLRGGRTPHSSVHPGCSLLHGYRQFCLAIGSGSAELPSHWLSEEVNSAFIGNLNVADCCDWPSSWASAPWRLGLCKHPGCFFQWSVFISSSVLPVCADWGWESLRSRESGESEANWLPVLPYALWLKKHSVLLWHFDNITGGDANNPQSVGSLATLALSSSTFSIPTSSSASPPAASVTVGGSSPTGYMLSLWWWAEQQCLGAQTWKINCLEC